MSRNDDMRHYRTPTTAAEWAERILVALADCSRRDRLEVSAWRSWSDAKEEVREREARERSNATTTAIVARREARQRGLR